MFFGAFSDMTKVHADVWLGAATMGILQAFLVVFVATDVTGIYGKLSF